MNLKGIGAKNDMPYGWISESYIHRKIWNMWQGMLRRCYYPDEFKGGSHYKECTCHSDFLLLSNFVKWIEMEPKYPEFCNTCNDTMWSIDKDGIVEGNKDYSYGKISLVTHSENCAERNKRNGHPMILNPKCQAKAILGISIQDKTILYYQCIRDVDKEGSFTSTNIVSCLKGRQQKHKGYKWFYANNLIGVMNYLRGGDCH